MADPGAGVDVVVAEGRTDQLLHQVGLFVGAARRGDAANRITPVFGLDAAELAGRVADGLVPADLLPGVVDALADHGRGDAVLVGGIAPGKAALDAGVALVGLAVLPGHHAHHFVALHLGLEAAAHAAVGAGGDGAVLGLTQLDDGFLLQRGGGAGFDTGAAAHALGLHERLPLARRDARLEAPALDGQRKRALGLLAGAHAAVADDALAGVVAEIRVGVVHHGLAVATEVVGAVQAVAHLAQTGHAGHVLQLAVAIGRAGQAVQRVVGDVQLHHALAQLLQARALGVHLHAGLGRCGARGREALAALHLDQAQPARAE